MLLTRVSCNSRACGGVLGWWGGSRLSSPLQAASIRGLSASEDTIHHARQLPPMELVESTPYLDISIARFYPVQDTMLYEVVTWDDGTQRRYTVARNYTDFQWLYDRLMEEDQLAGCLV